MSRKPPKISRKQLELIRSLAERCGAQEAARVSMATLTDPAGRGVNVFNTTTAPGTSSFGRVRQLVDFISGPEASLLIDALRQAAPDASAQRSAATTPDGMRRLDRVAERCGVQLDSWGKSGREFVYARDANDEPACTLRYKPQGKGTFYIESRDGSGALMSHMVAAAGRIEGYFRRLAS